MSRQATRMPRRGFTLIELLIVVTIIGILASLSLGALYVSTEHAREARTRSIITRLDAVVMARWESYRTRRLPIDPRALAVAAGLDPNNSILLGTIRLKCLRDIMRMELPEKWDDITTNPDPTLGLSRTALSLAYQRRYLNNTNPSGSLAAPTTQFQNAECLYLIVTMGAMEEDADALDTFRHEDVGDADEDGAPEFHDAWGQPIRFQRWVPGFASDLQPDLNPTTVDDPSTPEIEGLERDTTADSYTYNFHDPFDPQRLDTPTSTLFRSTPSAVAGYRLYPLIYSAGPDGQADLLDFYGGTPPLNDPYYDPNPGTSTAEKWLGAPHDFDGDGLNHLDNIHNQQLGDLTR